MAVLKVKVVSIIGRMADLDQATTLCGKSCSFHPDNALSFYSDTSDFSPLNEENPYSEPLQQLADSLAGSKKKLTLLSADEVSGIKMSREDMNAYVDYISSSFSQLQKERADAQLNIQNYTNEIEKISHFVGLDLDLDQIHACKYIKVRFGALPRESYEKLNSYKQNPYVIFFPSTSDATHYWGVYFSPIDMVSEVDRIFSSLYFERTRLTELTGSPETGVETLRSKRDVEIERIKRVDERFEALWKKEKTMCQKVYSWLTEQSVYFGIRRYAARYNDNFILTGWIPADQETYFKKELDKVESLNYTFEGAEEELLHSPPVELKNKKVFRPFEFFVDMYGLPCYDEVDPTPFVALTYFLLFGIMFGDLGQGLCVSLIGWYMWKKKQMKLGRILIPCGVSSGIFGLVFGSVFGFENALDPIYRALGFAEKPVEVMKPATTNMIIYSAVGIGVILVILAILINIYSSLKRKHYENALFGPNGVAGFIFYTALVAGFGGQVAFGWQIVSPTYVLCFIILPIAVMFFREVLGGLVERKPDWKPEKWGDFIMQNFFEVFEFLLSFATNTMSFLRVGAFVLVHAGMMLVVFTLAGMSGGIGYVLIVMIGNVFVMALEGLLVGIQVLRLEFYEMFSRFFDGGGRPFNPVVVRKEQ
ncbi:V-type ATP synthase subunit I [Caproiciproducens faecalis]|uniref:ATPase n=1 Tax=Caproiciproducens faecalis TaxID=2820301 RepID=A0ABS7DQH5_9FIRM|nr:V-type ATPase 116kDa subunit family protein [Caproiciproducens faecalis]MBW7573547.1 ATPase [Caproiciproducens faecalis]